MTLTEARRILDAKPEFGSKPNPKLHKQAREVVVDWQRYKALPEDTHDLGPKYVLLRKHPSFAREK